MSLMEATPADVERRHALNRMRGVALGLLVLAAVIFCVTLPVADHLGWGWLHTASEAAMVGGLADWFAVTALFRRPLGLPIPHTAIIPRRKNDIGRSLQQFVNENFLTAGNVRDRLDQVHATARLGEWLDHPERREQVLQVGARITSSALDRITDEDVSGVITEAVLPRLADEPLAPVAGSLLEKIVQDGSHTGLVDLAADELHRFLRDNPEAFASAVGGRAPRWSPGWVDRRVIAYAYRQVLAWVAEVRDRPDGPVRVSIDRFLARLADDLQRDEEVMARFAALQQRLLTHPQVPRTAVDLWGSVRETLRAALADRGSAVWQRADRLLAEAAGRLRTDAALQRRLDGRVADVAGWLVTNYGDQLTEVITMTIERWDARQASRRIELFVGRDLQFIRINGTVVGALAGLAIHGVALLLG